MRDGRRRWLRPLQVVTMLCVFLAAVYIAVRVRREGVESLLPQSLPLAALVLLGLYAVKSVVVVIPFAALFIAAGVFFPMGWAFLISYTGLALDAAIGYAMGKRLGPERMEMLVTRNKATRAIFARYGHNRITACFVCRMLPVPFEPLSVFFGATGLSLKWFLLCTLLGVTPNVAPYIIAGKAIDNPLSAAFLVPFGVCLLLAAAMFLILRRLEGRAENMALPEREEGP